MTPLSFLNHPSVATPTFRQARFTRRLGAAISQSAVSGPHASFEQTTYWVVLWIQLSQTRRSNYIDYKSWCS